MRRRAAHLHQQHSSPRGHDTRRARHVLELLFRWHNPCMAHTSRPHDLFPATLHTAYTAFAWRHQPGTRLEAGPHPLNESQRYRRHVHGHVSGKNNVCRSLEGVCLMLSPVWVGGGEKRSTPSPLQSDDKSRTASIPDNGPVLNGRYPYDHSHIMMVYPAICSNVEIGVCCTILFSARQFHSPLCFCLQAEFKSTRA